MITWLNENQGSVISVLTLLYVVATILILNSNRKSAKAATTANKQQLALLLLDRRLNSYYILNEWVSIAKSFLDCCNLNGVNATGTFLSALCTNTKNSEFENSNNYLRTFELILNQASISDKDKELLDAKHEQLLQNRTAKRFAMLDIESGLIRQIEVLFPTIEFKAIESFLTSFIQAAFDDNAENIEQLKCNIQEIIRNKTLESLWGIIKISND